MTTITPTPFAEAIAINLTEALRGIHVYYADQVAPAISAATDHRDFGPARQLIADAEHIADAADEIGNSRSALGDLVHELVGMSAITAMLNDIDPERLANEDRLVAGLRDAGHWDDDDEAARQLDNAARSANYPEVTQ